MSGHSHGIETGRWNRRGVRTPTCGEADVSVCRRAKRASRIVELCPITCILYYFTSWQQLIARDTNFPVADVVHEILFFPVM